MDTKTLSKKDVELLVMLLDMHDEVQHPSAASDLAAATSKAVAAGKPLEGKGKDMVMDLLLMRWEIQMPDLESDEALALARKIDPSRCPETDAAPRYTATA